MGKEKQEPSCWGVYWDKSAVECDNCALASKCERLTKQRNVSEAEVGAEPADADGTDGVSDNTESTIEDTVGVESTAVDHETEAEVTTDLADERPDGVSEVDPLSYLLNRLAEKYERNDKENDVARAVYFAEGDKTVVLFVISKSTGRIKIKTKSGDTLVESIETIERAEEIFRDTTE